MLIAIIVMAVIILSVLISFFYLKDNPNYITEFLKKNPERSSFYLIRNDSVLVSLEGERLMPLASTVKIIIAIEYTMQVSKKAVMKNDPVDLNDINKFYLPNTDAGAHKSWLGHVKNKDLIKNNAVPLEEVVNGMIGFSSNANAEFLIAKLGIENINTTLKKTGLDPHTNIYPFVSSLIVCSEYSASKNSDPHNSISKMSDSSFISEVWNIHERLKNGDTDLLNSFKIPKRSVQKIWSDRLPASTTKAYCVLMNKINTGKLLDTTATNHLKQILDWPLEIEINKKYFTSLGMKGGSTAFIVTETLFATDTLGNNTALAIFFNDLADWEKILIDWNLNKFELKILLDEKFRNDVKEKLSN